MRTLFLSAFILLSFLCAAQAMEEENDASFRPLKRSLSSSSLSSSLSKLPLGEIDDESWEKVSDSSRKESVFSELEDEDLQTHPHETPMTEATEIDDESWEKVSYHSEKEDISLELKGGENGFYRVSRRNETPTPEKNEDFQAHSHEPAMTGSSLNIAEPGEEVEERKCSTNNNETPTPEKDEDLQMCPHEPAMTGSSLNIAEMLGKVRIKNTDQIIERGLKEHERSDYKLLAYVWNNK